MKAILYLILFFLGLASVIVTLKDFASRQYFQEFDNIKSLKHPNKYMSVDTLKINRIYGSDISSSNSLTKIIEGSLISNNMVLSLGVNSEKYIYNTSKLVLYKSKLTNRFFLKNAPKNYYRGVIWSLYTTFSLKIIFLILIIFLVYQLIKYQRNKIYRL